MTEELVGPLQEMSYHVREALTIFCKHSHLLKDKTTRDHLHNANRRLAIRLVKEQEPSESPHVEETPFVYVASSMRDGKVDGQRVVLQEIF